ncbi:MAG: hypothetical protein RBS53_01665 [Bacteroidales bacterium]|jgi:hypothetical protein|nr:hypothetical protein [Bacteroidales bacterium]NLM93243.1 hypothetical protein [Bacteroidales bacterium]
MKKILVLAVFATMFSYAAVAQSYNTGIGGRGGVFNGLTFKQFISSNDAFEIVGAIHYGGLFVSGMYQRHTNAFDVPGLNWYYGGGAFIGFYSDSRHPSWSTPGNHTGFGVNGVVGLEYKIDEIPISLGVDLIPALDIIDHTRFWLGGGVTVRFVF